MTNGRIREMMLRRDAYCPFCNLSRKHIYRDDIGEQTRDKHVKEEIIVYRRETWFGDKKRGLGSWIFNRDRRWEQNICYCRRCGSKWRGEPYEINFIGGRK